MAVKLLIVRCYGKSETKDNMIVFDADDIVYRCKGLELPWNNNMHDVSCIPEGTYDAEKITRPNGKPAIWIKDVPDRSEILIHVANYANNNPATHKPDLKGCIAPGVYFLDINEDGYIDISESTKAMNKLLSVLPETFKVHIL
jgi:hypothetical protein